MAIRHAILGLLHYRDMHGYKIKSQIEHYIGHMWSINYGQIYPNLKSMLGEDLISMQEVNQAGERGPSRKLYSITEKGKQEFAQWIITSPEKGMVLRDPFLTKFVFFQFGDKNRALEIIDDQIRLYEDQLNSRKQNFNRFKERDIYVRLISELGVEQNEAFLRWLKRAKKEILQEDTTQKG